MLAGKHSFAILLVLCTAMYAVRARPTNEPAFLSHINNKIRVLSSSSLSMTPRYDPISKRWEATTQEDDDGYGPTGSLLRQGPVPFVRRLLDPDSYEQGVYKMMANANMSRKQAQGNMDAYLQNPNDWALQKFEEKQGKVEEYDYAEANMSGKDLALTGVWSLLLLSIVVRIIYVSMTGCDAFCQEYHF